MHQTSQEVVPTGFYEPCLTEMKKTLLRQMEPLATFMCDDGARLFSDN
jgi:hypothetical protein